MNKLCHFVHTNHLFFRSITHSDIHVGSIFGQLDPWLLTDHQKKTFKLFKDDDGWHPQDVSVNIPLTVTAMFTFIE